MQVYALLSWFDEDPAHLERCVGSCAKIADHVVAVDGAYMTFPGAASKSAGDQRETILSTARESGLPCDVFTPTRVWGSEAEKRAFMFEYARECGATPDDWLLIVDGDTSVGRVRGARDVLAESVCNVGMVRWWDTARDGAVGRERKHRSLFRALPGLTVKHAHWLYMAPQGDGWRYLFSLPNGQTTLEPAENLQPHVHMLHHQADRVPERSERARVYYHERDQAGLEFVPQTQTTTVAVAQPTIRRQTVKVLMKVDMSGTRNGVEWPRSGSVVELPDHEGAKLCAAGIATPLPSFDDHVEKRKSAKKASKE